jgi:hypothetical protein
VPEKPLVADVMNGKDGSSLFQRRHVAVEGLEINGRKARLPIIAVDNVRPYLQSCFQDGAAEEGEAFGIVFIIASWGAIEIFTVVVRVLADKEGAEVRPFFNRCEGYSSLKPASMLDRSLKNLER